MVGVLGLCFFSSPHVWDFWGMARIAVHPVQAPLHFTCLMNTLKSSNHSEVVPYLIVSCWMDTFKGSRKSEVGPYHLLLMVYHGIPTMILRY